MDELAINTSELTKKKKKAKIDFILDLNKAFKSIANNNKPPKVKKRFSQIINTVTDWSNKLMDSKGKQDYRVIKKINENSTSKSELNKYRFNV
ncbi:hypothetical protein G9A89_013554 [Geosiphon pyriformis]|nr:hypothetical protein G9A89_013554 [Geosiphon pyriformis]